MLLGSQRSRFCVVSARSCWTDKWTPQATERTNFCYVAHGSRTIADPLSYQTRSSIGKYKIVGRQIGGYQWPSVSHKTLPLALLLVRVGAVTRTKSISKDTNRARKISEERRSGHSRRLLPLHYGRVGLGSIPRVALLLFIRYTQKSFYQTC